MAEHSTSLELDRAYQTLSLRPGSPRRVVVRQFRRLVRRWHPDQFANDPHRYAEATRRMQDINVAFELVSQAIGGDPGYSVPQARPAPTSVGVPVQHVGRRLTEDEIEAISKAIGEPGIVQFLMRCFGLMGSVGAAFLLLGYGGRSGWRPPRIPEVVVALLLLGGVSVSIIRTLLRRRES